MHLLNLKKVSLGFNHFGDVWQSINLTTVTLSSPLAWNQMFRSPRTYNFIIAILFPIVQFDKLNHQIAVLRSHVERLVDLIVNYQALNCLS